MIAHERVCVTRGKHPLPPEDVAVGFLALRFLSGEPVDDAIAAQCFEKIGLSVSDIPSLIERAKILHDANYGKNADLTSLVRQSMQYREQLKSNALSTSSFRRSVWRTLRVLVLVVGLGALFLALADWLDQYFEYEVATWLCRLLSALICGAAAMVVFFPRFVYRKVVAVTRRARLLVRKFEEETRP